MALDQSALLEFTEALKAGDGAQLMRTAPEAMLQALIEAEATAHIGAEPHERSEARSTQRNGHRDKHSCSSPDVAVVRATPSVPSAQVRSGRTRGPAR